MAFIIAIGDGNDQTELGPILAASLINISENCDDYLVIYILRPTLSILWCLNYQRGQYNGLL